MGQDKIMGPSAFRELDRLVDIDVSRRVGHRGFDAAARPLGPSRRAPRSPLAPSRTPRRGDRSSPPASRRPPPMRRATSSIPNLRSNPLGLAVAMLAPVAPSARRRPARDGDSMAPGGLPVVLALEEQVPAAGPARDRRRDS